ncbi:MAG: 2-dehydropantoate 2-reductase [Rhodospirillaceae bacterium]|nr:2-dehydropantoate 2-reductase [Rhodospirillaceae bacterium]
MPNEKNKHKVAIYGAGAIGGHLGAMMSKAGFDVSLIARGDHLKAIHQKGLKLITQDQEFVTHPRVTDDPSTLEPQDYVVISLKSYQAPGVVEQMQPLLGPKTTVATAMNGIPWWYFYKLRGKWENHRISSVDPDGTQWEGIGAERAIGCITYVASEVTEPGIVKTASPSYQYQIGEPDGSKSERCKQFQAMVTAAGIHCDIRPDIRRDIWIKVMGNVAYNPTSALTTAHTGAMLDDPSMEQVLRKLMAEVLAVGKALGANPEDRIDARLNTTRQRAASHKTSMLQDLERGRPMEIMPIVGATAELAKLVNINTPTIDTVLALVKLRAKMTGQLPSIGKN